MAVSGLGAGGRAHRPSSWAVTSHEPEASNRAHYSQAPASAPVPAAPGVFLVSICGLSESAPPCIFHESGNRSPWSSPKRPAVPWAPDTGCNATSERPRWLWFRACHLGIYARGARMRGQ